MHKVVAVEVLFLLRPEKREEASNFQRKNRDTGILQEVPVNIARRKNSRHRNLQEVPVNVNGTENPPIKEPTGPEFNLLRKIRQ